jgi:hypothetical protein
MKDGDPDMTLKELGFYVDRRLAWGNKRWDPAYYLEKGGRYMVNGSTTHWRDPKKRYTWTEGPTLYLRRRGPR